MIECFISGDGLPTVWSEITWWFFFLFLLEILCFLPMSEKMITTVEPKEMGHSRTKLVGINDIPPLFSLIQVHVGGAYLLGRTFMLPYYSADLGIASLDRKWI